MGYNTFANSTGPDDLGIDLKSFLEKQKKLGAVLTAIREVE